MSILIANLTPTKPSPHAALGQPEELMEDETEKKINEDWTIVERSARTRGTENCRPAEPLENTSNRFEMPSVVEIDKFENNVSALIAIAFATED